MHKVAFFTLNSPPLNRDVKCSKLYRYAEIKVIINCQWNTQKIVMKYFFTNQNFYKSKLIKKDYGYLIFFIKCAPKKRFSFSRYLNWID